MKRKNATRNALFTSILSLLLCVSMLVGTTFAWFTDEVVSGLNTIQAGNLDIALLANDVEVESATTLFDDAKIWEPGVVVYENLQIVNKGTLALKYQMSLNFGGENDLEGHKLSEVLKVAVLDKAIDATTANRAEILAAAQAATNVGSLYDFFVAGELEKGESTDKQAVVVFWAPNANEVDNLYNANNGKTTSDGEALHIEFGVNLVATQKMSESDSFGTDYDKDAWSKGFAVYSAPDLQAAINNGEANITVMADIEASESIVIPAGKSVVINLNGKNLKNGAAYNDANSTASSALVNNGEVTLVGGGLIQATNNYTVRNYGKMVIDGINVENGIMNFADLTVEDGNISNSRSGKHTIYGNSAKLTINGGKFYNGNPGNAAIFSYAGEVEINGGEFSIADGTATLGWTSCLLDAQGSAKYTITGGIVNGEIRDYNKNTSVSGGTFAHSSVKNFIAPGYKAVAVDGKYVVVPEEVDGVTSVSDTPALINAIKTAPTGEETMVLLADGTYAGDLKITVAELGASGGDVVIKAAEGANPVITGLVTLGYRNQGVGAEMYNANVTFEGITFDQAENGQHSISVGDVKSLTLKDCTIIGDGDYGISSDRGNATGVSKIVGCTFKNAGMQLLGNFATGLVIDDCTFVESHINVQAGNGVTVQNCKFENTLTAANVGDSFYAIRSNSTPITVKDCEFAVDSKLTEVATAQAKWYLLANRGTTNWTVENVAVTLTAAAQQQTELKITACTSTGSINTTNVTVNGVAL